MNNLAIICGSLSRGGAERVTVYLSKYMVDKGIKTTIVTAERRDNEYAPLEGVERVCLSDNISKKHVSVIRMMLQIKNLHLYIKENNIDTVLIMGVPVCIYAIPGCVGTKVKIVVSERNDPENFAGKKIVKMVSRFFMKRADGFVFQTENAKLFYRKKLHNKGVIISNPLLIDNLAEPYEGKRKKEIVTAGRLNPQKNQELLIDAFSRIANKYPDYRLIIYGEGILEKNLKKKVDDLGLASRVDFPGNVQDLHDRIRAAAVFVLSSDFEGMPNALIEAMALGIPCISTNCPCGGPKMLIESGVNGLLVNVNDINAMSNAIEQVLFDVDKATEMGYHAQKIRKELSMDKIGQKWYEYLNSI